MDSSNTEGTAMSDTDDGTVDIHQILAPWKEGDEVSEGWKLGDVRDPFPGVFEVEIVSTGEEPLLTMRLFARDDDQGFLAQSARFNISDVSSASVEGKYFSDDRDAALKAFCRHILDNDPLEPKEEESNDGGESV